MTTPDLDLLFALNMKAMREHRGIGQGRFAELMAERGYSWHQSTIPKVETGARAIRVGEAAAVADILDVPIEALFEAGDLTGLAELTASLSRVTTAEDALAAAQAEYDQAVVEAREQLVTAPDRDVLSASKKHQPVVDLIAR